MIAICGFLEALGCTIQPRRGELTALPRPPSWFKRPTCMGMEGRKGNGRKVIGKGWGRKRKAGEGNGRGC